MKQLAEILPIILFFVAYKSKGTTISIGEWSHELDGIFSATAILILATALTLLIQWLLTRHVEKRQIYLFLIVTVIGGATLIFRNELFIQWKPTIFNWGLGLAFLASQFIGNKNLIQRALDSQIDLPEDIWRKLNYTWTANFLIVGTLNLVVVYSFSEAFWVSYKLYSAIGFTLLISIITGVMIAPHIKDDDEVKPNE